MRIALINLNTVVNITEASEIPNDFFGYQNALESDTASIGDVVVNGAFVSEAGEYTEPDPVDEIIPVSMEINSFQAKAALVAAGLYPQVQAHIATLPLIDQLRWQEATTFRRDNEYLVVIATGMGMTSEQIDDLFVLGNTFKL